MKTFLLTAATLFCGYYFAPEAVSQTAPTLNRAAQYAVFTSVGEFSNTGTTNITGNIGNGAGAETGDPVTVTGTRQFGGTEGVLTALDVTAAYNELTSTITNPCGTVITSPVSETNTFLPGVYCSTTAAALSGDIIFDGNGNPDAVFIIKVDGALSVNSPTNITLTGGASLKNVYWQVNGAFNLAAGVEFKGTLINAGAISLASGASVIGRALSTGGMISLNNNNISNAEVALPVTLVRFTAKNEENKSVLLTWNTTSETNSDRFEVERRTSKTSWIKVGALAASKESGQTVNYSYSDYTPKNGNNMYRLKMIDQDNTFAYSSVRSIHMESARSITLFPNPAYTEVSIETKDIADMERVEFNDLSGKSVLTYKYSTLSGLPAQINVKHLPAGLYMVRMTDFDGNTTVKRMVKN
jgi:hypothetical protein